MHVVPYAERGAQKSGKPTGTPPIDRSPGDSASFPVVSPNTSAPVDPALVLEWMGEALDEARTAEARGEVPVGALVIVGGAVVARRHNERELTSDPCAHAEVLALRDAAQAAGSWRLEGATLVVTLEPCPMCAGAALAARVSHVVFGAADPKAGACGSLYNLCADPRFNHEIEVTSGVRAEESSALLTTFFAARR